MTARQSLQRVHLRQGFPPYAEVASFAPASCSYGAMLSESGTGAFTISREDRILAELGHLLTIGALVTIERADKLYPWAGFIARIDDRDAEPVVGVELKDHAGE